MGTPISFVAPTIISCVQLGATVDYAILLTSRFREELKDGKNKFEAMKKAASESLRSVFQSAVIFFLVTIGVYFVSSISIVKEICELLARGSIISALIIVFVLTPILLISEKFILKTTKNWGPDKSVVNTDSFTAQAPFIQNPDNRMVSFINDCEENSNEDI